MSKRPGKDVRHAPVQIGRIPTGVPGLDEILGGGLPEYSFNIIAGAPGSGKTTLAHQIMFANAGSDRPALYFTVLGEPAIKMLRYQQQFSFFDMSKVDGDSFRTVVRRAQTQSNAAELELQGFVQRLALHLTSWQATSFLVGEYTDGELRDNPVFTVADGLFWLYQSVERNSIVRKMQVMKIRGQAPVPGLHTFRITEAGLHCFPRTFGLSQGKEGHIKGTRRISTGIAKFDEMLGGGIPEGESLLLAGPSGSGKSTVGMQFIDEGLKQGEPGIVAIFEEIPTEHVHRAAMFGIDLDTPQKENKLKIIYLRPLDLSVDETVHEIVNAVNEIGARRLVIDSLVGFEMALAPGFREDFRESLYRMIAALTRLGVTIISTVEIEEEFTSMDLSKFTVSFLADDIVRMRYVSINGQWRKMLVVVKMRRSKHSIDMHEYEITSEGVVIGEPLRGYRALTTGIPQPWSQESGQNDPDLQDDARSRRKKEPGPGSRKRGKRGKKSK
jgi:circadian clock protein KaiC